MNTIMESNDSTFSNRFFASELLLKKSKSSQDLIHPGKVEVGTFLGMVKIPVFSNGNKVLDW